MRAAALCAMCACLIAGCTPSTAPAAAISPGAASSARTGVLISPPPVTPPTPPGDNLPAFACKDLSASGQGTLHLTAARVGQQVGYDRFVLEFDSGVPAYSLKRQAKPVFTESPSGIQVTLIGTAGVLLQVQKASGANTYSGPTDFAQAGYPTLKEARRVEDFENAMAWGFGLGSSACMRAFTLKDPYRLVIDFQSPAS